MQIEQFLSEIVSLAAPCGLSKKELSDMLDAAWEDDGKDETDECN